MIRTALALIALVRVLGPAHAAPPSKCAGSTQMDINQCAGADLKRADTAMNAAYSKLMGQIGSKAQAGLREAQKAWLPFRDKTCALEAQGTEGGSMQPMVIASCLTVLTTERTKALRGYLTCSEGDASCVGRFSE
ncbi:lysozyme inhibitor LprI family protein [Methylobacterium sp. Leaf88]|uniref:lysozyme inhibitor LprI family protein n=1 Tax=Methylobacterium sp. Leaf88 TaxID=1736244 RepID=UPI000700BF18|nr:lysozyme inhibitor LprI family protein [Methylobacterium sp. Leaf88]KQO70350.1 hypothetical protein ASF20_05160 [Methylobacterium sp. Leaf88]